MAFVNTNRSNKSGSLKWGVEPICEVLQVAPSTYYAARNRQPSKRSCRDEVLRPQVLRVFNSNRGVYGAAKIWAQLNRENIPVARCTVERLMGELNISGLRRGRAWTQTTDSDHDLLRPDDLVDRQFKAPAPNRLWVADITYVKTHSGWVYVAFVIDVYSRMVVGWQASTSLRSDLAIDALEMAIFMRQPTNDLVHHSDRGVQYLSIRYSERLAGAEILASVGSKGDSYDNALAESFNSLYKWELIYKDGPWAGLQDVEFATLSYVDWFNNHRLHSQIHPGPSHCTPAEAEATYYRQNVTANTAATH